MYNYSSSRYVMDVGDQPRSYGFFVMVRGRLNPDDAKLSGVGPYGTFYRSVIRHPCGWFRRRFAEGQERFHFDTWRELGVRRT